ncbi:beta-ketoacyl-[acyl-carrier-protein] synthase family protein [Caecibacteroides pullorum]|uniref:3-oxoacyl-[acyl-carrier-protein] synthase 1 n=1 Tax=Caecibacteroides pullorum TaxID=2725562 RepID=A0AA40ZS02_9BACT|nr:beta-ketoacyl-[acyl-carrier-protein] synthase family protein [Caecibacteroides pullorum]MBM6856776.1 beta-ketoacyl-[acyl-carrier-protein] synthase family protein [Caecibacteroides pullorum]MBV8057783.1 beta-ketoacyl-[acyl-carrier-protein] synthase family protein [Caecibacteroides pullorum]
MEKRVVITGMGIWSCIGTTLDEVRDSLYKGKSGIVFNAERKSLGFRSALCADVPKPDLKPFIPRNQRQFMPEEAQYAYMATRQALEDAKLDADYMEHHEIGLIYGNDSVAEATMHALDKFREFHDTAACGSGAIFQSMNSTVTMNLACLFRLKGINLTASAACASGSQSIGLAALLIRNGLQECVVCGGAQEANLYSVAAFDGIQSFSVREDHPTCASRPFDRDRDGLVPGGGAATVVLESYEHAVRRGAPIWGEIVGWGFSGNGDHISTPNIEGPVRSLEACLRNSGVTPKEIGYINAHATSTRIGDAREAQAIARVFGDWQVPVTSTKGQTGHEMWMAGASELIYSMLMMKNDFIAGNLNFENPDEETACIHVLPERKEVHFDMFLSNSFGFGGTNSTLIVKSL